MQTPAQTTPITVSEWWTAVESMSADVEREMKTDFESAQRQNTADFQAFQKAKEIYQEMATVGKEFDKAWATSLSSIKTRIEEKRKQFGATEQQAIVGPLTLKLAEKYLALQKRFNQEGIKEESFAKRTALSKGGFQAVLERSSALSTAILQYSAHLPQKSAAETKATPDSDSTQLTTESNAAATLPRPALSPASSAASLLPEDQKMVERTPTKKSTAHPRPVSNVKQKRLQRQQQLFDTNMQHWKAVQSMATAVSEPPHTTTTENKEAPPSHNSTDFEAFNSYKKIYGNMAIIALQSFNLDAEKKVDLPSPQLTENKEATFGEAKHQKVIGPLTLELAEQYLALQKKVKNELKTAQADAKIIESLVPADSIAQLEIEIERYFDLKNETPLQKIYGKSIKDYLQRTAAAATLPLSCLDQIEAKDPIEFAAETAVALAADNKFPDFLTNLNQTLANLCAKPVSPEQALSTDAAQAPETPKDPLKDSLYSLISTLTTQDVTTALNDAPSKEDKQKMARSLTYLLAVMRDPTNQEAAKKLRDNCTQTVGASDKLKKFFATLCLIATIALSIAGIPLTNGASIPAGYAVTGSLLSAAGASTLFYRSREKQIAAKMRAIADATDVYQQSLTPR